MGFSLVEAALVLSLVGTLLAVFVPTFVRNVQLRKCAEAVANLESLHHHTAAYFASRQDDGVVQRSWCLPEAAGPTPRFPLAEPLAFDFLAEETSGHATWRALDFHPERVRYRYSFLPEASGCGIRRAPGTIALTLRAEGDLDQDGELSVFERSAAIDTSGHLLPIGGMRVVTPME